MKLIAPPSLDGEQRCWFIKSANANLHSEIDEKNIQPASDTSLVS